MLCRDMEPNNKINTRNQRKGNNNVLMSKNGHPTTKADINSEVSLSFQDELAATIHGAFEVAVEIAVLEITKLVGQALGDVRDQMHETLRENKALQLRLQATELELDAVRTSCENQTLIPPVTVGQLCTTSRIQQDRRSPSPHINSQAKTGKLKNIRDGESNPKALNVTGPSLNVALQETYGVLVAPTETNAPDNGSFSEIREDGRVCSQDLKPHLGAEPVANEGMGVISASKRNCPGYTENQALSANCDQECPETALGGNTTSSLYVDPRGSEVIEVRVKEEKSELDRSSGSVAGAGTACASHAVGEDDFGSDSLSLAQSRLLEDWRPEPLHLQRCDTDTFVPCASHSLSDPAVFNADTTDPNGLSPSASGLHPFPSPYTNHYQPEVAGVSALQQAYGVQISSANPPTAVNPRAHVCKVCNEAFHLPGELRRHHNQCHGNKALSRNPKRQTFPPGRSPYHCSQCGRDFNRMENLKTHLRIHTGERPYSCSVCGVRFRHSGALTRHFRIHTGEKPYVCSQCGKTFRNCGGLRFHQRSHMRQGQSMAD